jgi:hypothetical protein
MRYKTILLICGLVLICTMSATAGEVPDVINFQGVLLDSGDEPISAETNATFTIFLIQ